MKRRPAARGDRRAAPAYPHRLGISSALTVTSALGVALCLGGCHHRMRPPGGLTQPEVRLAGVSSGGLDSDPFAAFEEAVARYGEAARGGWEERECETVAGDFERISAALPGGFPEALFNAGVVWDHCGRSEEAERAFRAADRSERSRRSARMAGFAPALVRLGVMAYRRGDRVAARRLFERARQADRRSVEAYLNLATLQREEGDWSAAQQSARRAMAVNPDGLRAFTQMAALYTAIAQENPQMNHIAALVCQQAVAWARLRRLDEASLAPIYNSWGLALLGQGEVTEAVERFDRARQLDPGLYAAHMNSGALSLSYRDYSGAERAFREALEGAPDSYEAQLSLGVALRGLRRYDEALEAYRRARELDRSRPGADYNIAVLRQDYLLSHDEGFEEQLRTLRAARDGFRRVLSLCRDDPGACRPRREGDEPPEAAARRRLEACEATIASLRDVQQLASP